ncbi:hypothetical protein PVAP13_1KG412605 [Panicum virgatum]|uniref:Transmembrane protein n=1 Tax=Panicum virgatum TaxID=38727 RepID=A0A8T0XY58_PANVG|nr:hypothetical protein PVAP13_1KG412605 [Panicum virgatum]
MQNMSLDIEKKQSKKRITCVLRVCRLVRFRYPVQAKISISICSSMNFAIFFIDISSSSSLSFFVFFFFFLLFLLLFFFFFFIIFYFFNNFSIFHFICIVIRLFAMWLVKLQKKFANKI